jgi:hypothetical protein
MKPPRDANVHQSGSHIILETEVPSHQRIAVSNHKGVTREAIVATL